jgi:type II secretory pathway pseudopilin PulG
VLGPVLAAQTAARAFVLQAMQQYQRLVKRAVEIRRQGKGRPGQGEAVGRKGTPTQQSTKPPQKAWCRQEILHTGPA